MSEKIQNILIVGGGTAGWMTACILAKRMQDMNITLIESSDVPTVGVGEATIIRMAGFLSEMGLGEKDWMTACNATYKEGIFFDGFHSKGTHYWHPFQVIKADVTDMWLHRYHQERLNADSYFDMCYSNTVRNGNNRINVENKVNFDAIQRINYTYHLDAGFFAQHLKENIAKPGGVKHIVDNVTDIEMTENGWVSGITTESNGTLEADLYIDCSGFRSLLLQDKLGEKFVSYLEKLPNDRAIAMRVPYADPDKEMHPFTSATALDAGWVWKIPLWHRLGTGYVYSGSHKTESEAEEELRTHLGEERVKDLPAHHIKMHIGRCARVWRHNVVAIGLAAGFVEPLESTGIELAQLGAELLSLSLLERPSLGPISQRIYNAKMQSIYDEIADYIQLHYILTNREDTPYWRDQKYTEADLREETLAKLLRREASFNNDESGDVFSNTAWNSILIGMRMLPIHENMHPVDTAKYRAASKAMDDNFRAAKRQSVAVSNGVKNPSHFEFLSNTVYKGVERPET